MHSGDMQASHDMAADSPRGTVLGVRVVGEELVLELRRVLHALRKARQQGAAALGQMSERRRETACDARGSRAPRVESHSQKAEQYLYINYPRGGLRRCPQAKEAAGAAHFAVK